MKLYNKKLDSVEALKREKIRLRYERRSTKHSDLNPLGEIGGSKITGSAKAGLLGTAMDLFTAKNNLQMAMAIARPLLKAMGKRKASKQALRAEMGLPKKQSFLKKLFVEVAVGYITGKAVLMAVRAIRIARKRRKVAKLKAKLHVQ